MLRVFGTIHVPIAVSFLVLGGLTVLYFNRWIWALAVVLAIVSIIDDLVGFALVRLPFDGMVGTAVVLLTALALVYLLARMGRPNSSEKKS